MIAILVPLILPFIEMVIKLLPWFFSGTKTVTYETVKSGLVDTSANLRPDNIEGF